MSRRFEDDLREICEEIEVRIQPGCHPLFDRVYTDSLSWLDYFKSFFSDPNDPMIKTLLNTAWEKGKTGFFNRLSRQALTSGDVTCLVDELQPYFDTDKLPQVASPVA